MAGAFALALLPVGNVVIGLQPGRGYHIDPDASYHAPDLDPSQRDALAKTGLLETVGEDRVVWRDPVLGAAAAEASRRGEAWIAAYTSAHPPR